MSTLADIRTGVATALATITPGNGYTNDLSAAGQVIVGLYDAPPRTGVACAMVGPTAFRDEHDEQLGRWRDTATITILAWAPATADTPSARATASVALLDDLVKCMRAAVRTAGGALHGKAIDLRVNVETMDDVYGDVSQAWGVVGASVELWYKANSVGGI